MIEPMKKVFLIVQSYNKGMMLHSLRNAGVLHIIDNPKAKTEKCEQIGKKSDDLERISVVLSEYADKKNPQKQKDLDEEAFERWYTSTLMALDARKELREELVTNERELSRIRDWGDFDVDSVLDLRRQGINLTFFTMGQKEMRNLPGDLNSIILDPVGGLGAFALVNDSRDQIPGAVRFDLPEVSYASLQKKDEECRKRLDATEKSLKDSLCYVGCLKKYQSLNEQAKAYETISGNMDVDGELCYLQGYLPTIKVKEFEKVAKANSWGYDLEEIGDDDNPPTLLSYKKGVDMMKPIYAILGIVPGYRERDISFWFLLFFTLFFAMIVGDGGYGLVFLAIGIVMHKKSKKASEMVRLIYLLSFATIAWGAVTGTWFGSKWILVHLPFLKKLVIPQIANIPELFDVTSKLTQDTMMNFCFLIGTVQLSLACVMNIIMKVKKRNISLLADIGWLIDILALYQVILMLVFGKSVNVTLAFAAVGVGFFLVLVFGNQAPGKKFSKGLGEGLGGILPTFLNTISCFSNTMSYIRLFAVGMAGFAIASSFNSMAADVLGIKIIGLLGFALIVLVGHGLNLVMALLSVIVHGVRLNILEFSNQLGQEWSGYRYDPFRETVKEK